MRRGNDGSDDCLTHVWISLSSQEFDALQELLADRLAQKKAEEPEPIEPGQLWIGTERQVVVTGSAYESGKVLIGSFPPTEKDGVTLGTVMAEDQFRTWFTRLPYRREKA